MCGGHRSAFKNAESWPRQHSQLDDGRRSAGFLYVSILDTFHTTRSQASWPVVLMGGVLLLAGLISGPLAHKFTARPVALVGGFISALGLMLCFYATSIHYLVVTLGIVHAIGSGMVFVVIPTVINEHFLKYRGLAMGINFAGSTMGTFVFPKLLEFFSHYYGFRGALLLFGALSLNSIAFSLFLRQPVWLKRHLAEQAALAAKKFPSKKEDPRALDADVKKAPVNTGSFRHGLTVFSSPMFYVIMYSYIAFSFAFECYISFLLDFAVDRGVQVSHAVTLLSASSIADLVGRLTLPAVADGKILSRRTLITASFIMLGTLYVMLPYAMSYGAVFAMATGIAFFIGTSVVLFSVLLAEYLGIERVSMAYGMVAASAGMTSLGKPFVVGYFRDVTGSYDNLFRLCGSIVLGGAVMWIIVLIKENSRNCKW
ncbi:hypothetical protein HPB47_007179, partial [Ixodes persulcatus]